MVFVSSALNTYLTRLIYKTFTWPFSPTLKWWALYIPNWVIVDYMIAPFNLLTWKDGLAFWAMWKFWGHIFFLCSLVAVLLAQTKPINMPHHK